jgi:hypothetical protein
MKTTKAFFVSVALLFLGGFSPEAFFQKNANIANSLVGSVLAQQQNPASPAPARPKPKPSPSK